MARHNVLLTFSGLMMLAVALHAQEATPSPVPEMTPSPTPLRNGPDHRPDKPDRDRGKERRQGPKFWEMRERLEKMPPEQRKEALQKLRRWQNMPNDEQAHRRFMQDEREKRIREAVAAAIQASGLQMDEAQRIKFTEIYKAERRKLEEKLRAEMDQKRNEQMPLLEKTVLEVYKTQIAATPAASPTP